MWTDGQANMTKLIFAFHNVTKKAKKLGEQSS